jgi:type II restriction enzyme
MAYLWHQLYSLRRGAGRSLFVRSTHNVDAQGWLLDVLVCVERIKKKEFSLEDVYAFEAYLQAKHPSNHRVKEKTQSGQQLQILRGKGIIEFLGRGRYQVRDSAG